MKLKRIFIASMGCSKNTVDSELMAGLLQENHYLLVEDPQQADVIIVHTCGFIEAAKEESINAILEAVRLKKGSPLSLVVTGCLAQRFSESLWSEIPEIDLIMGTGGLEELPRLLKELERGGRLNKVAEPGRTQFDFHLRPKTTGPTAYLKIAEGCNHRCAFCAIPQMRGPYQSRPVAEVAAEARLLAAQGVKELVLIAQDTSYYGRDRGDRLLAPLLAELTDIRDLRWIRLLYSYPTDFPGEVLEIMRSGSKLVSYLDLPLQHASDRILRLMRRPGGYQQYLDFIESLRTRVPGITLRSTFIVGFPGETDRDFSRLLRFLKEARLDWAGFFSYSPEEGTSAAEFKDQIPEDLKQERYQEAVALQETITAAKNREFIGRTLEVLSEGEADDLRFGRAGRQAPEVDGLVYFAGRAPGGTFTKVKITGAQGYDLLGEQV